MYGASSGALMTTQLPAASAGAHFVMNAVGVLAAIAALGADLKRAAADLARWQPYKGRGGVERVGGITILDDSYNANPASLAAGLETLAGSTGSSAVVEPGMLFRVAAVISLIAGAALGVVLMRVHMGTALLVAGVVIAAVAVVGAVLGRVRQADAGGDLQAGHGVLPTGYDGGGQLSADRVGGQGAAVDMQ